MKISRPEGGVSLLALPPRERGTGVAAGLNESLVHGGQLCGWDSDAAVAQHTQRG